MLTAEWKCETIRLMKITWAYIAGFFDGEGCLHALGAGGEGNGRFRATISQAEDLGKRTLQEIADFLTAQGIFAYICAHHNRKEQREHPGRRKPMWNLWITQQRSIRLFIEGMLPYLRIKKQRAEDYRRYAILFQPLNGLNNTSQIKLRRDVFFNLMASGKSIADIARIHGMDYSSVWIKAKRFGYKVNSTAESNILRAHTSLEDIVAAMETFQNNCRKVAEIFDIPLANLKHRLNYHGIPWMDPGGKETRGAKLKRFCSAIPLPS